MTTNGLTGEITEFIKNVKLSDMNEEIIQIARDSIIDCIGVGLAGNSEQGPTILREEISRLGGIGKASLWGTAYKTDPTRAALFNGTAAHVLDYDDLHARPLFGHPSVCLVPAVFALAEELEASGAQVIEAYVTGFEVGVFLGYILGDKHYNDGWHSTSNLGTLRAASACCKLLNLEPPQITNALGLAASMSSGLRANFGSMTKSFHAGFAAQNGILAVLLAAKGFTAKNDIVEAQNGFAMAFSGEILSAPAKLGESWFIKSPGIALKKYPSCAGTHRGIDAVLKLVKQYDIDSDSILKVKCGVPVYTTNILTYHHPCTGLEGKFSMEYCLAAAIIDKEINNNSFLDEKVRRPEIEKILPLMEIYALEDSTVHNAHTKVEIFLKDSRRIENVVYSPKGDPGNPMSFDEIGDKFLEGAEKILGKERSLKVLSLLENPLGIKSIKAVTDLLSIR